MYPRTCTQRTPATALNNAQGTADTDTAPTQTLPHLTYPWYSAAIRSNKVRTAGADWTTNRAAESFPTSSEGRRDKLG